MSSRSKLKKMKLVDLLFKESDKFHIAKFGLPHFQRGSVWDDRNVGLLLESLFYNTPIGILILWKPHKSRISKYGTIFEWSSMEHITHLVIDGQQRLTALEKVKQDLLNTTTKRFWALNCAALHNNPLTKKYSDQLVNTSLQRRGLFVQVTAQQQNKNDQRVARLVLNSDHTLSIAIPEMIEHRDQFAEETEWKHLQSCVQQMFEQTWSVCIYNQSSKGQYTWDLPAMVSLYNRLNIAGRPVSSEERAYAALVRAQPELVNDWFRERFAHAHEEEKHNTRKFMARKREHQIGMTFFLRCLIQSLEFHFNRIKANRSMDTAHNEFLLGTLEDKDSIKQVKELFAITGIAVDCFVDVLRTELACDDFRFVPSAKPLRLAFDVVLQFTGNYKLSNDKRSRYQCIVPRDCIAEIILQLQLLGMKSSNFDKKDKDLRDGLHKKNTLTAAVKHFHTKEDGLQSWTHSAFKKKLEQSQTVQSPWVSFLYWLQRSNHATDPNPLVSKQNEHIMLAKSDDILPLIIEKNTHYEPQKEHIIPFSHLIRISTNLRQKDRNKESLANSIGNLTFITSQLNYRSPSNEPLLLQTDNPSLHIHHGMSEDWIAAYNSIVQPMQRNGVIYELYKELENYAPNTTKRKQCLEKIEEEYAALRIKLNGKQNLDVPARVKQLFEQRIDTLAALFEKWTNNLREKSVSALQHFEQIHGKIPQTKRIFPINHHEVKKVREIVGEKFHTTSIHYQKKLVDACLSIRVQCDSMKNVWSTEKSHNSDIIKSFGDGKGVSKKFRFQIKELRLSIGIAIDEHVKKKLLAQLNRFLKDIGKEPNSSGEIKLNKYFRQHPPKVTKLLNGFAKILSSIQ